jgi:Ring finger domain
MTMSSEERLSLFQDNECAICYESLCDRDILQPCRHRIHKHCFLQTHSNRCPICRQIVKKPRHEYYYYSTDHYLISSTQLAVIFAGICLFYIFIVVMMEWRDIASRLHFE